jgi:hypothetical protein
MFLLTMGQGMSQSEADVCLTPMPAPTPVPYPNISMSAASAPVVPNVLVDAMPVLNKLSVGLVSVGDQAGVGLGVASHFISGATTYEPSCSSVLMGGAPVVRLGDQTGQNCLGVVPNCAGAVLAPSQTTVLILAG